MFEPLNEYNLLVVIKMDEIYELISLKNKVFKAYVFYAAILIVKMFLVTFLTIFQRFRNKVSKGSRNVIFDLNE